MEKMPELKLDGCSLQYQTAGQGSPIVFIHAGVADLSMWAQQVEAFKDQHQVVTYDTRGYGQSFTEDVEFSNRQDLKNLLDSLGLKQVVLVGCSRGGSIAIDFTLEFPEHVRALVMVCAGVNGVDFSAFEPTEAEQQFWGQMEALEAAQDWEPLSHLEARYWLDGPNSPEHRADPDLRAYIQQTMLKKYQQHQHSGKPIVLNPPAGQRLSEIRIPVLVMQGLHDESPTVFMADHLAQHLPNVRKVMFEDAAHVPNLEVPEQFNAALQEFLERAEG